MCDRTGAEVCPAWAAETRDYQHHVTGDIGFAVTSSSSSSGAGLVTVVRAVLWQVRQYLAATGDTAFFRAEESGASGCDLLRAVAEFWASRVSCAEAGAGVCEIKQVPRDTRDT